MNERGVPDIEIDGAPVAPSAHGPRATKTIGLEHLQETEHHGQNLQEDRSYGLLDTDWRHLRGRF